jgi:hypothetical protein
MIVAAGWLLVIIRSTGNTVNWLGAKPKLHIKVAPLQTCSGMGSRPFSARYHATSNPFLSCSDWPDQAPQFNEHEHRMLT